MDVDERQQHRSSQAASTAQQGIASAGNVPGARYSSGTWADSNGNLWALREALATTLQGQVSQLNDLWSYNLAVQSVDLGFPAVQQSMRPAPTALWGVGVLPQMCRAPGIPEPPGLTLPAGSGFSAGSR